MHYSKSSCNILVWRKICSRFWNALLLQKCIARQKTSVAECYWTTRASWWGMWLCSPLAEASWFNWRHLPNSQRTSTSSGQSPLLNQMLAANSQLNSCLKKNPNPTLKLVCLVWVWWIILHQTISLKLWPSAESPSMLFLSLFLFVQSWDLSRPLRTAVM